MNILPEIQRHLVPLKTEEYAQLEKNILQYGCRDPLVLWNDTLIDGHNRYSICTEHDIKYDTVEMAFNDLDDALAWIEDNQLGRRNLTIEQFRRLIGRKYNRLKNKHGGDRGNQYTVANRQNDGLPTTAEAGGRGNQHMVVNRQNDGTAKISTAEKIAREHGGDRGNQYTVASSQNGNLAKTAEKIAAEHGVSKNTVIRAGALVAQIDRGIPELQDAVMQGKAKAKKAGGEGTEKDKGTEGTDRTLGPTWNALVESTGISKQTIRDWWKAFTAEMGYPSGGFTL